MQEPIRILMLFTILNRGGAETMVMNYYRNIDRTRVQFDFLVHREERGAYEDEIEAMGGRIYRMIPFHPLTFGKYRKQIAAFFDAHPEYRIVHGHCSELGYFVYREAHKRGVPVIIAHAHSSQAMLDTKWLFRTYFKHAMQKYVTQIFTCGEEAGVWLAGKRLSATAILQRNAIDTQRYRYSSETSVKVRESLGIPADCTVIGHVGSFQKVKNHAFLIEVFQALHQCHPHTRLVLVGEGSLRMEMMQKVKDLHLEHAVMFLGSRSDVPDLLKAMDVFVFPSLWEGLSVAMMEAQSAGLPCVVSDTIPAEVAMTDLVSFVSLKAPMADWVTRIQDVLATPKDRTCYPEFVAAKGYDIQQNAAWLQNYYVEHWKNDNL